MEDYEEYIEQHNNIANYYNDINVENNIKNIMNKLNYSHNDISQDIPVNEQQNNIPVNEQTEYIPTSETNSLSLNEKQDIPTSEPITINDLDFSSCEKNKGKNNKEEKVYYYKDFK